MNQRERQQIESLFERLAVAAAAARPRDPEAEALIAHHVRSTPDAAFHLAEMLLRCEGTLRLAEARLALLQERPPFEADEGYGEIEPDEDSDEDG